MIQLTRLNGSHLTVNCDLIRYMESSPDTVLTLVGGEKLVVLEPCEEIAETVLLYHAEVLRMAWPTMGAKPAER
jgi:flagellar protein FlbD